MQDRTIRISGMLEEFVGLIPILAKTVVLSFIALGALELLKLVLFPAFGILESQGMTILFITAASGVITHLVGRSQRSVRRDMDRERRLRIEAEASLDELRARLANPFMMQPIPIYAR